MTSAAELIYIPQGDSNVYRQQTISDAEYQDLVTRARQLGVWGAILRTKQYPTAAAAAQPGPAEVPASVAV